MNEIEIIRKEAKEFYDNKIRRSSNQKAIDDFHDISYRLADFYTSENKATFLDEIELNIKSNLTKHREKNHNGKSDPKCSIETKAEKLLFYIKQEIDTLPVIAHQRYKASEKKERKKVFVSYSHFDNEFLSDIKRHFKPFLSQIDFWEDSKIEPGQKWKNEIRKAIDETKVAILLVSTDFLGSEFISTDELPPLLMAAEKDGTTILILILKPCLFESFPKLNQYQAMNPPNRPISKMDFNEKEELYVNLVRQTKRILEN
jgi:hypothetical protein